MSYIKVTNNLFKLSIAINILDFNYLTMKQKTDCKLLHEARMLIIYNPNTFFVQI